MCIYSKYIQYIFSGRVLYMGMHSLALVQYFPLGFPPNGWKEKKDLTNQADGSGLKEAIPTVSYMALFHSGMRKHGMFRE